MTNPTPGEILDALDGHMAALEPEWASKLPGVAFRPDGEHQVGHWMPGEPMRVAMGAGAYHRQHGIFQIDIAYPKSAKRVDLLFARATAMVDHFYPPNARGFEIAAGAGVLQIEKKPQVSQLDESDAAYNKLYVSVQIRIELPPAA